MRLLHTKKFELQEFGSREVPHYAILSHTWGKEEVTLQDIMTNEGAKLLGYQKVSKACSVAVADGFDYIWIDTCCIDKTSSAELSEALNSMYRWYQEAEECYAYLADVPQNSVNRVTGVTSPEFRKSRWFTRGWTLQELIAPLSIIFLDQEWQEIETKSNLQRDISEITGIPGSFLLGDDLRHASVAQRMSWASKRETTRIEDLAYCLMGLFGIYMPMIYGEGERAFIRLQEEIMKVSDDHSLFAWRSIENHGGILANSPAAFADSGNVIPVSSAYATSSPSTLSSRGINLSLRFINNGQQGKGLAILHCTEKGKERMRLALHLRDVFRTNEDFVREQSTTLQLIDLEDINLSKHPPTSLYVRQWYPMRNRKWEDMEKCVVKLGGVDAQEVSSRITDIDSNCELSDGLMIMNTAAISNGILGRLLVVCRDGNIFQILLKKHGRSLSVDISTSTKLISQNTRDAIVPEKEQNDQDRIVKVLGDGQHVHVAIKKRVLLLREVRYLTGVVEISYSSTLKGVWLEHIAILGNMMDDKTLLAFAAKRGLKTVVEQLLDQESTESNSNDDLRTPLSWAAEGGQVAVVKHLLERGAALEPKDKGGRTPLSWAAGTGHVAIVRLLLAKAAVIKENEKNIRDQKPLSWVLWRWLLPDKHTKIESGRYDNLVRSQPVESKDGSGRTLLSWAAFKGHEGVVQLLLEKGADIETKDSDSLTPLCYATIRGYKGVVQLLLEKGADVGSKDGGGQTPLSWAAYEGHEGVVQLLLEKGADIESKGIEGQTPLWWAAIRGHEGVVQLLLEKGADIELKDGGGQTLLWWVAYRGHGGIVQLLLEKGADIETKDGEGRTLLSRAAHSGYESVVQLLLEKGADIESKDGEGRTLLSRAAHSGYESVVQLLLEKGADIESKDGGGRTPLCWATYRGHESVIQLLLEKGADIETKDREGRTLLSLAAHSGHESVIQLLLEKGADIESKDGEGRTLLSLAAHSGYESVVQLLLEKGADIESKNGGGRTPLCWATYSGHGGIVQLLLEKGADIESKDKGGRTPLWWATYRGHDSIVQLLLEKGADIETKDGEGRTPLWWATYRGRDGVAQLLLEKGANIESKVEVAGRRYGGLLMKSTVQLLSIRARHRVK